MLNSYSDIRSRLGEPLWYDNHGVPRYEPFGPDLCSVYPVAVTLLLIECQSCAEKFRVSIEFHDHAFCKHGVTAFDPPTPESIANLHYGDPPIHGCVGDTMNCIDLRVLEFWRRDLSHLRDWERDPTMEIVLEEETSG